MVSLAILWVLIPLTLSFGVLTAPSLPPGRLPARWAIRLLVTVLVLAVACAWLADQFLVPWYIPISTTINRPLRLALQLVAIPMILVLGAEAGRTVRQLMAGQDQLRWDRAAVVLAFAVILPSIIGISHLSRQLSRGSEAAMEVNYQRHKADFRRIVAMAEQEREFRRIAPDSPSTPAHVLGVDRAATPDSRSVERWEEYRTRLRATDVRNGIWISEHDQCISFKYWEKPLILDGHYKGYVYSARPLQPVRWLSSPGWFKVGNEWGAYRQIGDGWYLYSIVD